MPATLSIYIRNTADDAFSLADFDSDTFNQLLLNYQFADIKDPASAKGDFSYTINLPASANNNAIFHHAYENTIYAAEQVIKTTRDAFIEADGVRIFTGRVRVQAVDTLSGKGLHYECIFYGTNITWSEALSDKYLADLDFGTHAFDKNTIESSWTATSSDQDFVYPFISYGVLRAGTYAMVEDMRPALYVRNIIRKALNLAGFSYQSDFIDSDYFAHLIIPYFGAFAYTDDYINAHSVYAGMLNDQTIDSATYLAFQVETSPFYDNDSQWHTDPVSLAGIFTADIGSVYSITLDLFGSFTGNTGSWVEVDFWIEKNGDTSTRHYIAKSVRWMNTALQEITTDIKLAAGDTMKIRADIIARSSSSLPSVTFYAPSSTVDGSFVRIQPSTDIEEGDTVDFSGILDKTDMPLSGLLTDIFKVYNLYALTDYDRKVVIIEPRDTFFLDKAYSVDWTEKIDLSQPVSAGTLLDSYTQNIRLRFAEDSNDSPVTLWEKRNNQPYLSYLHTLPDGFQKGETPISTQYLAPTMMGMVRTASTVAIASLPVPQLYQEAEAGAATPDYSTAFRPRLLYYYGVYDKATFNWMDLSSSFIPVALPWAFSVNPKLDNTAQSICFDNHSDTLGTLIEKGLYQNYYASMLDAVAFGTMLRCKVYLTATDIAALMDDGNKRPLWRKLIWVKDSYYTINSITNYNPLGNGLCDVELMQYFPPASRVVEKHTHIRHIIDDGQGFYVPKRPVNIITAKYFPRQYFPYLPTGSITDFTPNTRVQSAILHNGTGNSAVPGVAAVVMAQGGIAIAAQMVTGNYNLPNAQAIFQVGNGTGDGNRANAFEVTDDGAGTVKAYVNGVELATTAESVPFSSDVPALPYDSETGVLSLSDTYMIPSIDEWNSKQNQLNWGTGMGYDGLTATVTATLATGKAGGQAVIGGTASGENLTVSSTSNATKGSILFGSTSGMVYDEANKRLGIGGSPVSRLTIPLAPTASPNYGMVSLGTGPFDGTSAGHFTGSSSGTFIAINKGGGGDTTDFMNLQAAGSTLFQINSIGLVRIFGAGIAMDVAQPSGASITWNNGLVITQQQSLPFTSQTRFNVTGGASSGNGTYYAIQCNNFTNAATSGANPTYGITGQFTMNQSGATGGYTVFDWNVVETSITSADKRFMDMKVGGTTYWRVMSSGAMVLGGSSFIGTEKLRVNGKGFFDGGIEIADGQTIAGGAGTGLYIGQTGVKLGFFGAAPVLQPTTAGTGATLVSGGGTPVTDSDTFDGYTLKQVVKALRSMGIIA